MPVQDVRLIDAVILFVVEPVRIERYKTRYELPDGDVLNTR